MADRYEEVNKAFRSVLGKDAPPDQIEQWAKDFIDTGRGAGEIAETLRGGEEYKQAKTQPYEDMAFRFASMELDARQREMEMQQQQMAMMERLMPLEEQMRQQEITTARARQEWEGDLRGFLEPLMRGEQLPGQFGTLGADPEGRYAKLGEPATPEELDYYWRQAKPGIDERLTALGLGYSGDVQKTYEDYMKDMALADIARSRGELAGVYGQRQGERMQLAGLPLGMPMQGAPAAQTGVSYQAQPSSALGLGYGMQSDALDRLYKQEQLAYGRSQLEAYNQAQTPWWQQVLGQGLGMGLGFGTGGLLTGLLGR